QARNEKPTVSDLGFHGNAGHTIHHAYGGSIDIGPVDGANASANRSSGDPLTEQRSARQRRDDRRDERPHCDARNESTTSHSVTGPSSGSVANPLRRGGPGQNVIDRCSRQVSRRRRSSIARK